LTEANKAGGTGIDATFPAILLDDSCKPTNFNGTRLPWINKVRVNSVLASFIAHDPWSWDLFSSLQTKLILLFSAISIALLAELVHSISLKKAVTMAAVMFVPDGIDAKPFADVASEVNIDFYIV